MSFAEMRGTVVRTMREGRNFLIMTPNTSDSFESRIRSQILTNHLHIKKLDRQMAA